MFPDVLILLSPTSSLTSLTHRTDPCRGYYYYTHFVVQETEDERSKVLKVTLCVSHRIRIC